MAKNLFHRPGYRTGLHPATSVSLFAGSPQPVIDAAGSQCLQQVHAVFPPYAAIPVMILPLPVMMT